jgi:hypothetical protein
MQEVEQADLVRQVQRELLVHQELLVRQDCKEHLEQMAQAEHLARQEQAEHLARQELVG